MREVILQSTEALSTDTHPQSKQMNASYIRYKRNGNDMGADKSQRLKECILLSFIVLFLLGELSENLFRFCIWALSLSTDPTF